MNFKKLWLWQQHYFSSSKMFCCQQKNLNEIGVRRWLNKRRTPTWFLCKVTALCGMRFQFLMWLLCSKKGWNWIFILITLSLLHAGGEMIAHCVKNISLFKNPILQIESKGFVPSFCVLGRVLGHFSTVLFWIHSILSQTSERLKAFLTSSWRFSGTIEENN